MKSFTTGGFRRMYADLPRDVRLAANRAYTLFRQNPAHPGLNFKKIQNAGEVYSA